MAFRQMPSANAIVQGNLAQRERQESGGPTLSQGSAAAAKTLAGKWARGKESLDPANTSPPPWFGGRPMSDLRASNPGQFDEWKRRFDEETFAGFEFRPPPPEPGPGPEGGSAVASSGSGSTPMTKESA